MRDKKRTQKNEGISTKFHPIILIGVVAFLAIIFVFVFYYWNFRGSLSGDQSVWGQFGDFFGGVLNPILTFLTLIGVLYTIHLTRAEIRQAQYQVDENTKKARTEMYSEMLHTISKRLDSFLDAPVFKASENDSVVMRSYRTYIKTYYKNDVLSSTVQGSGIVLQENITVQIKALHHCLQEFEEEFGEKHTAFYSFYYKSLYVEVVNHLTAINILNGKIASDFDTSRN